MKSILSKLLKAKTEIGKISKDSTNPFFKSKYFDVNSLLEHVEPILQKNSLVLLQPISGGKVITEIFCAESGESIKSSVELPVLNDPQKLGSAITYYRRYTLQSLLALQAEDDDANKASKPEKPFLTEAGFKYLLEKGTKKEFEEAKKTRRIKNEFLTQLNKKEWK
jgi:hypothetical protein